jgi:hypothetical protein
MSAWTLTLLASRRPRRVLPVVRKVEALGELDDEKGGRRDAVHEQAAGARRSNSPLEPAHMPAGRKSSDPVKQLTCLRESSDPQAVAPHVDLDTAVGQRRCSMGTWQQVRVVGASVRVAAPSPLGRCSGSDVRVLLGVYEIRGCGCRLAAAEASKVSASKLSAAAATAAAAPRLALPSPEAPARPLLPRLLQLLLRLRLPGCGTCPRRARRSASVKPAR